jgi:hypothetical protein
MRLVLFTCARRYTTFASTHISGTIVEVGRLPILQGVPSAMAKTAAQVERELIVVEGHCYPVQPFQAHTLKYRVNCNGDQVS